jgi:hypothetical protein
MHRLGLARKAPLVATVTRAGMIAKEKELGAMG